MKKSEDIQQQGKADVYLQGKQGLTLNDTCQLEINHLGIDGCYK